MRSATQLSIVFCYGLAINIFVWITLAIVVYPEPYMTHFWEYWLSDLGRNVTPLGYTNPSQPYFIGFCASCAVACLILAIYTRFEVRSTQSVSVLNTIRIGVAGLIGIGFLGTALPKDVYPMMHWYASILGVGSFLIYTILFLSELHSWHWLTKIGVGMVGITFIIYMSAAAMDLSTAMYQKIFLISYFILLCVLPCTIAKTIRHSFTEASCVTLDDRCQWDDGYCLCPD